MDALLERMADGEWHEIAAPSSADPTAAGLDLQLRAMQALGVQLEYDAARRVRIPGGLELLDRPAIIAALSEDARTWVDDVVVLRSVDSTSAALWRGAAPSRGHARVCLADSQSAGRGRRGRHWSSPLGCNLYLSLDAVLDGGVAAIEGLSLAVGVVVAEVLAGYGAAGVALKWPNDLLVDEAKLGGILVEAAPTPGDGCRVVVGIGINVAMPAAQALGVDQRWTDLAAVCGSPLPQRSALAGKVLNALAPLLRSFPGTGFDPWRGRWERFDAFRGRRVVVTAGSRRIAGVARGVDERGALLLETASGIRSISGGEVSLRPAT